MEANDLKKTYNDIVTENKKLETKLKQIEKEKIKTSKQLTIVKKSAGSINTEMFKAPEKQRVDVLNQNPNELKECIREKREVFEDYVTFYEELKIKTKTDNLLFLANQTIYQQKLLLNTKKRLVKLKKKLKRKFIKKRQEK